MSLLVYAGASQMAATEQLGQGAGGMALLTYALRALPVLLPLGRERPGLQRALRYLPPTVLTGLLLPAILLPGGQLGPDLRLLAGLVGALAAWRTRNILATIALGLAVFSLTRWLLGG